MSEAIWYLRTQDETFGPETEEQLVAWAKLGRIQPGQEISDDNTIWRRVEEVPFLDMRFSIDIGDGNPRGPFHREAAEALLNSGRLPVTASLVETRPPFEKPVEPEAPETQAPEAPEAQEPLAHEPALTPEPQVIEKIVEKEVRVEVPVEKIVEKEVRVEVPVEKIVEKVVEKIVVDETRVHELEGLLAEERRHTTDLQSRLDEAMKGASDLKAQLAQKDSEIQASASQLKDSEQKNVKLEEQVVALEDELKRLPAAASEVADIQAAVFKIMQDEVSSLDAALDYEQKQLDESRKRAQARIDFLSNARREILKMSGKDLEDMTRKALVERPEDPRTTCLRRDLEELKRVHEKMTLDYEAKIRQLTEQVHTARQEGLRLNANLQDVTQLRAETEKLRETLKSTERELLNVRQQNEELVRREASSRQTLMARLASLESPCMGASAKFETNQSREAKMVKLPGWMRLKR